MVRILPEPWQICLYYSCLCYSVPPLTLNLKTRGSPLKITNLFLILFFVAVPLKAFASPNCIGDKKAFMPVNSDLAVVFDWDDTILPSTFLKTAGNRKMDRKDLRNIYKQNKSEWDQYDSFVSQFLEELDRTTDLYIISNALICWIEYSSYELLPQTYKVLVKINQKHRLVSAREFYFNGNHRLSQKDIDASLAFWKTYTFECLLGTYKNIISLGDAEYERTALFSIPNPENNMIRKNVKLLDEPDMELLLDQLRFIKSQWETLLKDDIVKDVYISEGVDELKEYGKKEDEKAEEKEYSDDFYSYSDSDDEERE